MAIQKAKVKFRYFVESPFLSTTVQALQNTESEMTHQKTPVNWVAGQKCDRHAVRARYQPHQINMHLGN